MKKLIVIALAVVMALSVVAFAACGAEETVNGTASYSSQWGTYGVEVNVTVKGNVITAVEIVDHEGWTRTSGSWTAGQHEGDLGFEAAEAAYQNWLDTKIVGQKVETVRGWTATATATEQSVGEGVPCIAGATQSSARFIVAIQNALSKLAK